MLHIPLLFFWGGGGVREVLGGGSFEGSSARLIALLQFSRDTIRGLRLFWVQIVPSSRVQVANAEARSSAFRQHTLFSNTFFLATLFVTLNGICGYSLRKKDIFTSCSHLKVDFSSNFFVVRGQPAEHVKKSRVKTARFTNFFDCGRVWTASRTGLSSCGRVFCAPLAHV